MTEIADPHRGRPVLTDGAQLAKAKGAVIMVHGRGADAADIIGLAASIDLPELAYLAPDAAGNTWYPLPFMTPIEQNEPHRTSALSFVARLIAQVGAAGIPPERTALLGFSQGACLSLEFAARNPRRYGAVIAFSGGLMGDDVSAEMYPGTLDGTPVFIGCSDTDFHIPLERVQASTSVFVHLGADVTERIYPGMGHTVAGDEIAHARRILDAMFA